MLGAFAQTFLLHFRDYECLARAIFLIEKGKVRYIPCGMSVDKRAPIKAAGR